MDIVTAQAASYALLAGALAAFNPCGFALLPAYITVLVTGSAEEGVTKAAALRRAITFGLGMTVGFLAVFSGFGLLFAGAQLGLQGSILPYLSYVTATVGVLLVILGIHLARGGELKGPGLKVQGSAPRRSWWSQVAYGATFALASMSCTIGPFLVVVTGALDATNPIGAGLPFLIYGLGMGAAVLTVSMVAALAGSTALASLRRRTPAIMKAAGWLMIVAGLYVFVYGLAEILQHFGNTSLNNVLITTSNWQSQILVWIQGWGAVALTVIVAAVVALAAWLWWRLRPEKEPAGTAKDNPKKGA